MHLPPFPRLLVTDFDGTMTRVDFFDRALAHLPESAHTCWQNYLDGRCTHFEALQALFSLLPADETTLMQLALETGLDPRVAEAVERLHQAGWGVVIASAGCSWYIERLLAAQGVSLPVHSNPGTVLKGQGLWMSLPADSAYFRRETGVDKAAIVRDALQNAREVAFAGDGRPDLEPSLLVSGSSRFARGWLASALSARGESFTRFERWSEVAEHLLSGERSRQEPLRFPDGAEQ